jgi:hypothetical protein
MKTKIYVLSEEGQDDRYFGSWDTIMEWMWGELGVTLRDNRSGHTEKLHPTMRISANGESGGHTISVKGWKNLSGIMYRDPMADKKKDREIKVKVSYVEMGQEVTS